MWWNESRANVLYTSVSYCEDRNRKGYVRVYYQFIIERVVPDAPVVVSKLNSFPVVLERIFSKCTWPTKEQFGGEFLL